MKKQLSSMRCGPSGYSKSDRASKNIKSGFIALSSVIFLSKKPIAKRNCGTNSNMIKAGSLLLALGLALAGMVDVGMAQTTVTVSATASHPIPSTMCKQIL